MRTRRDFTSNRLRDVLSLFLFGVISLVLVLPGIALAAGMAVLSWLVEEEVRRAREKDAYNS